MYMCVWNWQHVINAYVYNDIKVKLFSYWKYEINDPVHGTLIINIFCERVFFKTYKS